MSDTGCRFCEEGNPRVESSVRPGEGIFVHTDTRVGRVVCSKSNPKAEPGVYLELFHGRQPRDFELDDWGTPGPVFGPLRFVHTTYGSHVKMGSMDDDCQDLHVDDDLLYYDGWWYGDWSVFTLTGVEMRGAADLLERLVKYDEAKTDPPPAPRVCPLVLITVDNDFVETYEAGTVETEILDFDVLRNCEIEPDDIVEVSDRLREAFPEKVKEYEEAAESFRQLIQQEAAKDANKTRG